MPVTFHSAPSREIPAETLYRILWLRSAVFVIEQEAAYDDIDGRDLEADTVQFWAERDGEVVSTLRLLADREGMRIGRVATSASARGGGLSARLLTDAIARCGGRDIRLDAQSHLADWYGRFGFTTCGPEYVEDGIPHVPMLRSAQQPAGD